MYSHYFYWQYMVAPLWLLRFGWTLHQALFQLFSVRVMLTTLFAHWRRDRLVLRQGTISGIIRAVALNVISRVIGFIIRSLMLLVWFASECALIIISVTVFVAFIVAPLMALIATTYGLALILKG